MLSINTEINIFVTYQNEADSNADGSYKNPYGHIAKALSAAEDRSAKYESSEIKIYLKIGGDHFMERNFSQYDYNYTYRNQYSLSTNITIQPIFCGEDINGTVYSQNGVNCINQDETVTVHYKMGNSYQFDIPRSLTIKNIVFDALESSLDPSIEWLSSKANWCYLIGTQLSKIGNELVKSNNWSLNTYQNELWMSTMGNSLFQFQHNEHISNSYVTGTLNLEICTFRNFFHDFTSLVGLANGHGHVSITNSIFDKFSTCGSIIRDTREIDDSAVFDYHTNINKRLKTRGVRITAEIYKNKFLIVPNDACQTTNCSSITIKSSTFKNFNYLKPNQTNIVFLPQSSEMRYQGIILNLKNFYGDILIKNNTFDSLQFKFQDWSIKSIENTSNTTSSYLWSSGDVIQAKSLFFYKGKSNIQFVQNTFTGWNSAVGLIYIVKTYDHSVVLVHGNTFEQSSSLFGTDVLRIDVLNTVRYNETLTGYMPCTGVQISSNTFTKNIGCHDSLGTILVNWGNQTEIDLQISSKTSYSSIYNWPRESSEINILENVKEFNTADKLQVNEGQTTVDLNKFMMKHNQFIQNYVPNLKGLVNIYGVYKISISNDTYENNTFAFKEALNSFGSIYSDASQNTDSSGAYNFSGFFIENVGINLHSLTEMDNEYPGPPLYIQQTLYLDISSITFDNNYFVEMIEPNSVGLSTVQSQSISLVYCKGILNFGAFTLKNYAGIDTSEVKSILDETNTGLLLTAAPNERDNLTTKVIRSNSSSYYINFGFRNPIIHLYSPENEIDSDYNNDIESIIFDELNLYNLSYYPVGNQKPLMIELSDSIGSVEISYINITLVDWYLCQEGIFHLSNNGEFRIKSGIINSVNTNAYDLNGEGFSYVSTKGLFNIILDVSNISETFTKLFKDVDINNIYTESLFYFDKEDSLSSYRATVKLNRCTLRNINSTNGALYLLDASSTFVTIKDSTFDSNYATEGPADMNIASVGDYSVENTLIKNFDSNSSALSIDIKVRNSSPNEINFSNVTMYCDEDGTYRTDDYRDFVENQAASRFGSKAPIVVTTSNLITSSSLFKNWAKGESGGFISLKSNSVFNDSGSTFLFNAASKGGAIFSADSKMVLDSTTFESNYAEDGGAIFMNVFSQIEDSTELNFTSNYAKNYGGGILSEGSYQFSFRSSSFSLNTANEGSAIYTLNDEIANRIVSTVFSRNIANKGSTLTILFCKMIVNNTRFIDNYAAQDTSGIYTVYSTLTIENSVFNNSNMNGFNNITLAASNTSNTGGSFKINVGSVINLTNVVFDYNFAKYGGAIYVSGSSQVYAINLTVENWYAENEGGGIFLLAYNEISINSSKFLNNYSGVDGNDIYSESGILRIESTGFSVMNKYSSIYLEYSYFYGKYLTFSNSYQYPVSKETAYGGAIQTYDAYIFQLNSSSFEGLTHSRHGGALSLRMLADTKTEIPAFPTHVISNTIFKSNEARSGGALYVLGIDYILVSNCTFTNNSALDGNEKVDFGKGGAIFYTSYDDKTKFVVDSTVTLDDNTAEISGGAIYWNYLEITNISRAIYNNNSASLYGDNIAWFAQKIIQINEFNYKGNNSLRSLDYTSSNDNLATLSNQGSGHDIPDLYLALQDQYGQIVGSDSSSTITLYINSSAGNTTLDQSLAGEVTHTAVKGTYRISDISFTSEPGLEYQLYFKTTGIDDSKASNIKYLEDQRISSNYVFQLNIQLRNCISGEQYSISGACDKWEGPNKYSLDVMTAVGECLEWPTDKAICNGGSNIGPRAGYWRSSNATDNFIKWLYYYAWLGMIAPNNNPAGDCATGYQGILWADWKAGYSRTGEYQCAKWPNKLWNIVRISFVILISLIVVIVIIKSTLEGALVRKNLQSIYIKILMNHLQLILLSASFDFDWPENVKDYFNTTRPASQVSSQILSFDWFMDQRSERSESEEHGDLYLNKLVIHALLPIVLMLGSLICWTILYSWRRNSDKSKIKGRIIATIIILLFLVHPSIVQFVFRSLDWMKIDNKNRMTDDLNVLCWEGRHMRYVLGITVPCIIIWWFGIPVLSWMILLREKDNLNETSWREQYGFLYNGFKKKWYFWESINMLRKIMIIFIAVFLDVSGTITQALVVLLLLVMYLYLNIKIQPYMFRDLNDMETLSIFTSMITIYCGWYFLSDQPEIYNSSDVTLQSADNGLRLNSPSKMFLFLVILVSNLMFFAYWTYKMMGEIKNTLRLKFKKAYLYIFWWGNKQKMAKELRDRELKDEHDVLWEELENQLEEIKNAYKTGRIKLNSVVIEKSALYLNVNRYINEVRHKSVSSTQKDINLGNRVRERKNNKKIFQKSALALDSTINLNFTNSAKDGFHDDYDMTTIANKEKGNNQKSQFSVHNTMQDDSSNIDSYELHDYSKSIPLHINFIRHYFNK